MPDDNTLILLNTFIASRTKVIRNINVLSDIDLAELLETDQITLQALTGANLSKFKSDTILVLTVEEQQQHINVQFAFTEQGIFTLAGLIKSKRAIRIYVKLIELLVNRLQSRAYAIANTYQPNKA